MREQLCNLLALHAGQTLTQAVAIEIVRALFPDRSYAPERFEPGEYKGYTFQVERLAAVLPELHPQHEQHYAETEKHRAGIPLNMDYAGMLERERAGALIQFTAREKATGALVGNIRINVARSSHTQTLISTEDTYFVLPEHRRGFLAVRFWQWAEACGISIGIREARFNSKLVNKADRLALYLGYKPVGTMMVKIYGEQPSIAQERLSPKDAP